jgi:hypothetical protein
MESEKKKINTEMKNIQHPLFGISLKNWIKILSENGGVDLRYFPRAFFITISSISIIPARLLFKIRYESKIEKTEISKPPVFIIGHWRSGTTFLHELMSFDPQFCYVSLWNTLLPDSFLILNPLKDFLSQFLPSTRPMDQVEVAADGPYEEEAGLSVLYDWSFFHALHFPKNAEQQYLKSIHFQDFSEEELRNWKKIYLKFMKTVTFDKSGKRLILKNPPNSTRIQELLEIFPDAKFIHIYRNPYKVYLSTKKMRTKVLDKLALQNAYEEEIEDQVINNYIRFMNSFFKQKDRIPNKNFVEVSYEELVVEPLKQVKKIYDKLDLKDFDKAKPYLEKYLDSKKDYKTNVYNIDKKIIDKVKKNWGFTVNMWNYKPPK